MKSGWNGPIKRNTKIRRRMLTWKQVALALPMAFLLGDAFALPAKVIILRHGEKSSSTGPSGPYGLCNVGWSRSVALRDKYLGKDAFDSLLPKKGPAAFFAITPHTIELAAPSVSSWGVPLITYTAVQRPTGFETDTAAEAELDLRTQQAAHDVMTNSRWNNKVVVMIWEHKHIANSTVESTTTQKVTLRQLFNLDQIPGVSVPKDWSGNNYDYFWIVTFGNRSSKIPTGFSTQIQTYPTPENPTETDPVIPSNSWGVPVELPSECKNSAD